jgi:uncharacterized protein (TIGR02186 family)
VRRLRVVTLALLLVLLPATPMPAELVTALSSNLVAITTGFTGSNVLLFGTTGGEGDIIVVVRGPEDAEVVRRKGRRLGLWINEAEARFVNVPQFYAIAESGPIASTLSPSVAARHQIGISNLRLMAASMSPGVDLAEFRAALIRLKQQMGLYSPRPQPISFLGERLFRTDMRIPANAPVGDYLVSVFLVRNGEVTSAEITPLKVSKIGFEAWTYRFARSEPLVYGVVAVALAAVAGWMANMLFRKG